MNRRHFLKTTLRSTTGITLLPVFSSFLKDDGNLIDYISPTEKNLAPGKIGQYKRTDEVMGNSKGLFEKRDLPRFALENIEYFCDLIPAKYCNAPPEHIVARAVSFYESAKENPHSQYLLEKGNEHGEEVAKYALPWWSGNQRPQYLSGEELKRRLEDEKYPDTTIDLVNRLYADKFGSINSDENKFFRNLLREIGSSQIAPWNYFDAYADTSNGKLFKPIKEKIENGKPLNETEKQIIERFRNGRRLVNEKMIPEGLFSIDDFIHYTNKHDASYICYDRTLLSNHLVSSFIPSTIMLTKWNGCQDGHGFNKAFRSSGSESKTEGLFEMYFKEFGFTHFLNKGGIPVGPAKIYMADPEGDKIIPWRDDRFYGVRFKDVTEYIASDTKELVIDTKGHNVKGDVVLLSFNGSEHIGDSPGHLRNYIPVAVSSKDNKGYVNFGHVGSLPRYYGTDNAVRNHSIYVVYIPDTGYVSKAIPVRKSDSQRILRKLI